MEDQALILDRYRLVERLASGGSAEVWRAHDEQLDRPVAVKRLHPHLLPDAASRARLVAEARAVAALAHPVVVGIYDVDSSGESPALVMELVEGESLSARIERDGPLPERQAAATVADLAEALYHAHQRGVIHRDVKAGNVLLGTDGRTRLVDFGIAHSLAASAERLTLTGTVIGTLHSMAPEQLSGGPITPRTDLYGLGVVLHQALTGRPPFATSSPVALAQAQQAGPPSLDGVDPALAAVVAGCLSYAPADRPLHAGALAAALRDWLAGDPTAALALAPPARAAIPSDTSAVTRPIAAVPPSPVAAPTPISQLTGSRGWLLGVGAALVATAVIGAVLLSGLGPGAEPAAGDQPGATATPTATPTVTPAVTPSPVPGWFADRLKKVEEECGSELAAQAAVEMASLDEESAKRYAEDLAKECEDADRGGRGNGNGNGNGRGGDD
jgi:tRNA A-37 threonylcarbamoyl transferase component Bud32